LKLIWLLLQCRKSWRLWLRVTSCFLMIYINWQFLSLHVWQLAGFRLEVCFWFKSCCILCYEIENKNFNISTNTANQQKRKSDENTPLNGSQQVISTYFFLDLLVPIGDDVIEIPVLNVRGDILQKVIYMSNM
jgi:hypothetical protein